MVQTVSCHDTCSELPMVHAMGCQWYMQWAANDTGSELPITHAESCQWSRQLAINGAKFINCQWYRQWYANDTDYELPMVLIESRLWYRHRLQPANGTPKKNHNWHTVHPLWDKSLSPPILPCRFIVLSPCCNINNVQCIHTLFSFHMSTDMFYSWFLAFTHATLTYFLVHDNL